MLHVSRTLSTKLLPQYHTVLQYHTAAATTSSSLNHGCSISRCELASSAKALAPVSRMHRSGTQQQSIQSPQGSDGISAQKPMAPVTLVAMHSSLLLLVLLLLLPFVFACSKTI